MKLIGIASNVKLTCWSIEGKLPYSVKFVYRLYKRTLDNNVPYQATILKLNKIFLLIIKRNR